MHNIHLSDYEIAGIKGLLSGIMAEFKSSEDPAFLRDAPLYAHGLPLRLRKHFNDFRLLEPAGGICLVSGYPVCDDCLGGTPPHWKDRPGASPALEYEILLCLFGSLLGEMVAWATQQDGTAVHDVLPIKGHENEQLGSGSEVLLTWHSEDAFHPYRGDYIGLMCLRNPYRAITTVSSIDSVTIPEDYLNILFEPLFTLRPDESHLQKNQGNAQIDDNENRLETSYRKIQEMNAEPPKVAVLYGDKQSPYLRIDPYFMDDPSDETAREALNELIGMIDDHIVDVVLEPGDFLFLDNYKTVHGRKPFKAGHDGRDRWLKRINVVRDLRKSRDSRSSCESRVLF